MDKNRMEINAAEPEKIQTDIYELKQEFEVHLKTPLDSGRKPESPEETYSTTTPPSSPEGSLFNRDHNSELHGPDRLQPASRREERENPALLFSLITNDKPATKSQSGT
ncbi:unnamed protein product [Pleuronectes platessa]|uniref:Uncharacterized protein n=1 Tax=Pleuronectes platessa TaxID=8262 RepID=A0A9N7VI50_PLEPL|nr:unnamed protein product [Pleuronectes platessa]